MMAPPVRPMGGPPMPGAYPLAGMAMGTPPGGGGTVFPHYATGPRGSISSMGGSMGGSPAKGEIQLSVTRMAWIVELGGHG